MDKAFPKADCWDLMDDVDDVMRRQALMAIESSLLQAIVSYGSSKLLILHSDECGAPSSFGSLVVN